MSKCTKKYKSPNHVNSTHRRHWDHAMEPTYQASLHPFFSSPFSPLLLPLRIDTRSCFQQGHAPSMPSSMPMPSQGAPDHFTDWKGGPYTQTSTQTSTQASLQARNKVVFTVRYTINIYMHHLYVISLAQGPNREPIWLAGPADLGARDPPTNQEETAGGRSRQGWFSKLFASAAWFPTGLAERGAANESEQGKQPQVTETATREQEARFGKNAGLRDTPLGPSRRPHGEDRQSRHFGGRA